MKTWIILGLFCSSVAALSNPLWLVGSAVYAVCLMAVSFVEAGEGEEDEE